MATRFVTEPPPQRAASRRFTHGTIQEGGGAEVEPGEGMEGHVHVGPMRQEPTRAGRKRQQRREVTLGKLLWRDETLAAQLLRPPFEILAGQRRREVTLAGQREVTLAGQRRCEVTLGGQRRREVTLAGQAPTRAEQTRLAPTRAEQTRLAPTRAEQTRQAPSRAEQRPTAETGT